MYKEKIRHHFSRAVESYDKEALTQKKAAQHLVHLLTQGLPKKPDTILDVGTGTGFVVKELCSLFPHANYTLNDLSDAMLHKAQANLNLQLTLLGGDAEKMLFPKSPYDLITSNLTLQWFTSLEQGIRHLFCQCKTLAFTTLLDNTFWQWRTAHDALKLPSGLHNYPSLSQAQELCLALRPQQAIFDRQNYSLSFANPKQFVNHLKNLGAHTPHPSYTNSSLRHFLRVHQSPLEVNYDIFFAVLIK